MYLYGRAVKNINQVCLRLKLEDRFVVITDKDRVDIGKAILEDGDKICKTKLFLIEDYVARPAKFFPKNLKKDIEEFKPTVSVYAATGKEGELQNFRLHLIDLLTKILKCRHGHMINVDKAIMLDGMSQNYQRIQATCDKLYEVMRKARNIEVTCPYGTHVVASFSPNLRWKKDDGRINSPKEWGNLPAGEVFTCPASVEGEVVAWEAGDYFSEKYGVFKDPAEIKIQDSEISQVKSKNKKFVYDFNSYITKYKNGNRVGEFAIGCLVGLRRLMANLLQDEKFPGVHMAFGHPYPEFTGQTSWDCPTHIDVIPLRVDVKVDGMSLLRNGKFVNI